MTKETTVEATKVNEEENLSVPTPSEEELAELTPTEFAAYRKLQRDTCGAEIDKLLAFYETDLTARVIVGADAIIPQVFLVDAKPKG